MTDYGIAIRQQQEHGEAWVCPICSKLHTVPKIFKRDDKKDQLSDDVLFCASDNI
jgi:hypothetical protein